MISSNTCTFEFSLNVHTEFVDWKNNIQTCNPLCQRPGCYHSASKTQITDGIFKLILLHNSVFIWFPEFTEFPFHLGKPRWIRTETMLQEEKLECLFRLARYTNLTQDIHISQLVGLGVLPLLALHHHVETE